MEKEEKEEKDKKERKTTQNFRHLKGPRGGEKKRSAFKDRAVNSIKQ